MQKQQKLKAKQHFVPRFLLKNWAAVTDEYRENFMVHRYDLKEKLGKTVPARSIFYAKYLYEDSDQKRDNELENFLAEKETSWAATLRDFQTKLISCATSKHANISLGDSLQQNLLELTAFQLLRTPTAKDTLAAQKNISPENFNYKDIFEIALELQARLSSMIMMIQFSQSSTFFTSDNPCFQIKFDDFEPEFVRELGTHDEVILTFPLLPTACLVFTPRNSLTRSISPSISMFVNVDDKIVASQNELTVQQAHRVVICSDSSDYPTIETFARNRPAISIRGY